MNDSILKHKLKSLFHNLSKITNNPKLIHTNGIDDIVKGTLHLNKLFNKFIVNLINGKTNDELISLAINFKDLQGNQLFNEEHLHKLNQMIPNLRNYLKKNKKQKGGFFFNFGKINKDINDFVNTSKNSINSNTSDYLYHIYRDNIDKNPQLSQDKQVDTKDRYYFSLWTMEQQNPQVSKYLDSLILTIDNFDILLEILSPVIEEVKDLGMELVGAIPGVGTIASFVDIAINLVDQFILYFLEEGTDLILLIINISRKRWDDVFINLGEVIPEFSTIENNLNNYIGFISKYGSGMQNMFDVDNWGSMQNMHNVFNTDMFFKQNPFVDNNPLLKDAINNFSKAMPPVMRNKYEQCCEHFGKDDKRYEKCKNTPNFKPLGVGPKIKAYRKCKKNLDSGLDSDSDISVDEQNTTTNTIKNEYEQCCEHFGRDDKRYEKCKSKPNFKPLGVGPKIKAYRKCKKNLDSGLDSDSDISVDEQNTTNDNDTSSNVSEDVSNVINDFVSNESEDIEDKESEPENPIDDAQPENPVSDVQPDKPEDSVVNAQPENPIDDAQPENPIDDAQPDKPEIDAQPDKPEIDAQPDKPEVDAQPDKPEVDAQPDKPEVDSQPDKPEVDSQPDKPIDDTETKKPIDDAQTKKPEDDTETKKPIDDSQTKKTEVDAQPDKNIDDAQTKKTEVDAQPDKNIDDAQTKKPDVNTPKPDVNTPKPDVNKPKPDIDTPKPDIDTPKPDVNTPKPGIDKPKPVIDQPKPGIDKPKPKPGIDKPNPGIDKTKPGIDKPKPDMNKPKPSIDKPKPSIDKPKPGIDKPKPGMNKPKPIGMNKPKPISMNKPKPGIDKPKPLGMNKPKPIGMNKPKPIGMNKPKPGMNKLKSRSPKRSMSMNKPKHRMNKPNVKSRSPKKRRKKKK